MEKLFGRPLITQKEMQNRIKELGDNITADFQNEKDLLLVGVLKGAFIFYADLCRAIRLPICVDFLVVTSYCSRSISSGKVKIISELTEDVRDRTVVIVEDIVDSGRTLKNLIESLEKKKPKQIVTCALLSKPTRREVDVTVDYVGFEIHDTFVVGCGLDYQQKYRNLPYLASLDQNISDADK